MKQSTIFFAATLLLTPPFAASAKAGCCKEPEQKAEMKCMEQKPDAGSTAGDGCCKGKSDAAEVKSAKMAGAATPEGSHDGSGSSPEKTSKNADAKPKSDSTLAFEAITAKMHNDMASELTGDADLDFMKGMIPHHQGAIDMANVVIKHGKDPVTRKLAEEIIKTQETEIALMKSWLAKRQK